jgi:transcriptional regulator with XRE-family HTH domain
MKTQPTASDEFLLRDLGAKLTRARLERNLTQAQMAAQAGIALRTLGRIERGSGAAVVSAFIRVCRVLGLVERFMAIVPDQVPSPMEQLKLRGRQRRRATGRRGRAGRSPDVQYPSGEERLGTAVCVAEDAPAPNWKWGDAP